MAIDDLLADRRFFTAGYAEEGAPLHSFPGGPSGKNTKELSDSVRFGE